jgi:hypothetical protein
VKVSRKDILVTTFGMKHWTKIQFWGRRTSREKLAGNKLSEQKQDLMASFHKGPMPL